MGLSDSEKQELLKKYTSEVLDSTKKDKAASAVIPTKLTDDAAAAADLAVSSIRIPRSQVEVPASTIPPEQQIVGRRADYDLNKQEFVKRRGQ